MINGYNMHSLLALPGQYRPQYLFSRLHDDARFVRIPLEQCAGEFLCLFQLDMRRQRRHIRVGLEFNDDRYFGS